MLHKKLLFIVLLGSFCETQSMRKECEAARETFDKLLDEGKKIFSSELIDRKRLVFFLQNIESSFSRVEDARRMLQRYPLERQLFAHRFELASYLCREQLEDETLSKFFNTIRFFRANLESMLGNDGEVRSITATIVPDESDLSRVRGKLFLRFACCDLFDMQERFEAAENALKESLSCMEEVEAYKIIDEARFL